MQFLAIELDLLLDMGKGLIEFVLKQFLVADDSVDGLITDGAILLSVCPLCLQISEQFIFDVVGTICEVTQTESHIEFVTLGCLSLKLFGVDSV